MLNKAVRVTSGSKLSGDFPVKCKMEPVSGINKGRFSGYANQNGLLSRKWTIKFETIETQNPTALRLVRY